MSTNKFKLNTLATCAAVALTASAGTVMADTNPFGMSKLSSGVQVAMEEAKCGGKRTSEGKCGGNNSKASEGKCGGSKQMPSEGKCGGAKPKEKEGKCGEGKCGGRN